MRTKEIEIQTDPRLEEVFANYPDFVRDKRQEKLKKLAN